jgi:hypothetical protein
MQFIGGVLIAAYIISRVLVKTNKIALLLHKRVWDALLLLSFLLAGLTGLLFALQVNYGLTPPIALTPLHGNIGVSMVLLTIFHIERNWLTFKALMFPKKPPKSPETTPGQ